MLSSYTLVFILLNGICISFHPTQRNFLFWMMGAKGEEKNLVAMSALLNTGFFLFKLILIVV